LWNICVKEYLNTRTQDSQLDRTEEGEGARGRGETRRTKIIAHETARKTPHLRPDKLAVITHIFNTNREKLIEIPSPEEKDKKCISGETNTGETREAILLMEQLLGLLQKDQKIRQSPHLSSFLAPSHLSSRTLQDEKLRQENEKIFVQAFIQRIRRVMHNYLGTEHGVAEINHVINEIEDINRKASLFTKKASLPPQLKKRKNVYEVFRKFDTDGSDTIDWFFPLLFS
jgi:hypothetical protein